MAVPTDVGLRILMAIGRECHNVLHTHTHTHTQKYIYISSRERSPLFQESEMSVFPSY